MTRGWMLEESKYFVIGFSKVWLTLHDFSLLKERVLTKQPAGSKLQPIVENLPGGSPEEFNNWGYLRGGIEGGISIW